MVYVTYPCSPETVKCVWSTTWTRQRLGREQARDVDWVPASVRFMVTASHPESVPWVQWALHTERATALRELVTGTHVPRNFEREERWPCVCPLPTNTRNHTGTHKSRPTQTHTQVRAKQAELANKQTLTRNLSHQTRPSGGKTRGL